MTYTRAERIASLKVSLNESLDNSQNRVIVIVKSKGQSINGVTLYEYNFLIPEGDRTFDMTEQVALLLNYRYSKVSDSCTSQNNSMETKAHLCFALSRNSKRVYCDFVYKGVWNSPMDNWVQKD